jgi:hypothetical protein
MTDKERRPILSKPGVMQEGPTLIHTEINNSNSYSYNSVILHNEVTLPFFKTTYENLSFFASHLPSKGNGIYDTSKLQGVVSCVSLGHGRSCGH